MSCPPRALSADWSVLGNRLQCVEFGFSRDWDGVALPVYPRRASYMALQQSSDDQGAIPDRVAGSFARLLYVLSDGEPNFDPSSSIGAPHEANGPIEAKTTELEVSELLKFKGDQGVDAYRTFAEAVRPLIMKAGGDVILSVDAELPIVSHDDWDHLTLIRYLSTDAYASLFRSDEWPEALPFRVRAVGRHLAVMCLAVTGYWPYSMHYDWPTRSEVSAKAGKTRREFVHVIR